MKPFQVKSHLWVFVNALIENPAFDSQTKETLTTKASSFGSKCEISDEYMKKARTPPPHTGSSRPAAVLPADDPHAPPSLPLPSHPSIRRC